MGRPPCQLTLDFMRSGFSKQDAMAEAHRKRERIRYQREGKKPWFPTAQLKEKWLAVRGPLSIDQRIFLATREYKRIYLQRKKEK